MGLFWGEIKYLKSGFTLNWANTSFSIFMTSIKITYIIAQGTARLQEVIVCDQTKRKYEKHGQKHNLARKKGSLAKKILDLKLWPLAVLKPHELKGCIVSHLKVKNKDQLYLAE